MTLKQLILANNLQDSTAAEIVSALNEPTEERTRTDLIGPMMLVKLQVPQEQRRQIAEVFRGAAQQDSEVNDLRGAYLASGVNMADEDTRYMIDTMFTGNYAALGAILKSLGRWQISKAEAAGLGTITEQQATVALLEITRDARRASHDTQAQAVEVLFGLNADITPQQQVVRYAQGLLTTEQLDAIKTVLGVE